MEGQKLLRICSILLIVISVVTICFGTYSCYCISAASKLANMSNDADKVMPTEEFDKSFKNLISEKTALESDSAEIQKGLSALTDKINAYDSQLTELDNQLSTGNKKIAEIEAKKSALEEKQKGLDEKKVELAAIIAGASSPEEQAKAKEDDAALKASEASIAAEKLELEQSISALRTELAAKAPEIEAKKAVIQAELDDKSPAFESEKKSLTFKKNELFASKTAVEKELEGLKKSVSSFQAKKTLAAVVSLFAAIWMLIAGLVGKSSSEAPTMVKVKACIFYGIISVLFGAGAIVLSVMAGMTVSYILFAVSLSSLVSIFYTVGILRFNKALLDLLENI